VSSELARELQRIGETTLVFQVANVLVPKQRVAGVPEEFSFLAYPMPYLTREQREAAGIQEWRSVSVNLGEARIRIDLDDFGQINWFYVSDLPGMYSDLTEALAKIRSIPLAGNGRD
jgi:hypothetical protein